MSATRKIDAISFVELGIVDALLGLNRTDIAEIKTYGGEFEVSTQGEFAQVVSRFPAIWVSFSRSSKPKRRSARLFERELSFSVLAGVRQVRSEAGSRHGLAGADGQVLEVGSFGLIADIETALLNLTLTLPGGRKSGHFEPGAIRTLFNTQVQREAVSVLAYEWSVSVLTYADSGEEQEAWMDFVHSEYFTSLAPGAEATASDLIDLTQSTGA